MTVEVTCNNCGDMAEKHPSEVSENNFCNKDCYREWHQVYNEVRAELICEYCGEKFTRQKTQINGENQYCSNSCQAKDRTGEANPKWRGGISQQECEHCGERFTPHRRNSGPTRFCSQKCLWGWQSKEYARRGLKPPALTGEDHYNWKGGATYEEYPKEFFNKREAILERDGWECCWCGKTNEEEKSDIGRGLAVHHIDANKQNNKDDNLVTLCHFHNVRADRMGVLPQFEVVL